MVRSSILFVMVAWVLGAGPVMARSADGAATRRALTVPPGFQLVVDGGRNVLCMEGDESWVRQVIADKTPTSRPTTMPADLLEQLTASRDVLVERIRTDLALQDSSLASKFVNEDLIPLAHRAANFRPPLYYLVTTREALREIVRNGWTDPAGGYQYNRAADQVSVPGQLQLPLDGETDDQVLPAVYDPTEDLTTRREKLQRLIHETESQLNFVLAARSLMAVQNQLLTFIDEQALTPLKLERDDQQWFNIGVAGVMSARYLDLINGSTPDTFLRRMTVDDPRNPVRSATVNLLSPTNLADMRPAARPAYADALRRKSTAVVAHWLDRAPPNALPRTINALRANPPVDGSALVKLIIDQTGIDLTNQLLPR